MVKKGKRLCRVNLSAVDQMLESRNAEGYEQQQPRASGASHSNTPQGVHEDKQGSSESALVACLPPGNAGPVNAERKDAPKVAFSNRGSKAEALKAASSQDLRRQALNELEEDTRAKSSASSHVSYWKTWTDFHSA